jgi:hypothetical protein
MEIIVLLEIGAISSLLLWIILRFDSDAITVNRRIWLLPVMGAFIAVGILWVKELSPTLELFYGILAAYLITAAIIDKEIQMVHDFLHIVAIVPGVILLCRQPFEKIGILELLLFVLLQILLFRRMYGTADCLVFSTCALYMTALGHGMLTYLMHMAATFSLLVIVQAYHHNINKKGNLNKPVALVPYIAATVLIFL